LKRVKKFTLFLLKLGLSLAILGYLIWDVQRDPVVFHNLRDQPKQWSLLVLAWASCFSAVFITLVRWFFLVRALELPVTFRQSLRIGFLGYLFNLAPAGIVGGDVLKAWLLAAEHPGRRTRAVASVVVDRLIGLYMLFIVASVAILASGFWEIDVPDIHFICKATFALTIAGTIGVGAMMTPAVTENRLARALVGLPHVGPALESVIDALRLYRSKPLVLLGAALLSVGVHSLFSVGIFLIASGLPGHVFSLANHFVMAPLSAATGVLPLPIGPFEFVLEFLYTHVPSGAQIVKGQGLVVALIYRLNMALIAAVGVGYYFTSRRELADVMQKAEQDQEPSPHMAAAGDEVA
jgi:hypothetical protein